MPLPAKAEESSFARSSQGYNNARYDDGINPSFDEFRTTPGDYDDDRDNVSGYDDDYNGVYPEADDAGSYQGDYYDDDWDDFPDYGDDYGDDYDYGYDGYSGDDDYWVSSIISQIFST